MQVSQGIPTTGKGFLRVDTSRILSQTQGSCEVELHPLTLIQNKSTESTTFDDYH